MQLTHWRPDTEFWRVENVTRVFDGYFAGSWIEPPNLEGIEINKNSSFDTSLYDTVDEETEEDLLAPEPYRAL